jgi:methylmalonyl-CoA mutase, C-terminal domain
VVSTLDRPIRVLLGKFGLDLHDVGAKFIARGLSRAGMEVIYLGPFQTVASVLGAAVTESPDVVAISNVSGEYTSYMPELLSALAAADLRPVVILGGLVLEGDVAALKEAGVDEVFGPGTQLDDVVAYLRGAVAERSARLGSR